MMRLHLLVYQVFCLLEGLVYIVLGGERRRLALHLDEPLRSGLAGMKAPHGTRSLLIFAPTVGELNSVKPVIAQYRQQWPTDVLVLLTAYEQYLDLYAKNYPDAVVGLANFRSPWLLHRLFSRLRPRLLVISEGPALHARFPQRLEVALPVACLAHGVPVVVTNAVLFPQSLQSRIDKLEHAWFRKLFLASICRWFPPFPLFRDELMRDGAPTRKVRMLGDLRFDSLHSSAPSPSDNLRALLASYRAAGVPTLVAGSVNHAEEQQLVVNAWSRLRTLYPGIKLIIAPRYVNNPEVIQALTGMLHAAGAQFTRRSEMRDSAATALAPEVLVVDVFGELSHFYSVATVSYIGRDHGVLEPQAHASPTLVGTGWRRNYSATPMYDYMIQEGGILCVATEDDLVQTFRRLVEDEAFRSAQLGTAKRLVEEHRGASVRIMAELRDVLAGPAAN